MAVDVIGIRLDLDSVRFDAKINRATGQLQQLSVVSKNLGQSFQRLQRAQQGWLATFRDITILGVTFGNAIRIAYDVTFRWTKAILDANGELERMAALLGGMSTKFTLAERMEEANEQMLHFLDLAGRSPFTLQQLAKSAVKFKSVGLDPMASGFEALVDAVANFGGNDQILDRAGVAIQQMAGKGVISMEELRQQLGEAVPTAMVQMARAVGLSVREFQKMVSEAKVSALPALDGLFREMDRSFGGSSERMMQTWVGMLQRFQTEFQKFLLNIGSAGFFQQAKVSLQEFSDLLSSDNAKIFAYRMGLALTAFAKFVGEVAKFVVNYGPLMLKIISAIGVAIGAKFAIAGAKAFLTFGKSVGGAVRELNGLFKLASQLGVLGRFTASLLAGGREAAFLARQFPKIAAGVRSLGGPLGITIGLVTALGFSFYTMLNKGDAAFKKLESGVKLTLAELKHAEERINEIEQQAKDGSYGQISQQNLNLFHGLFNETMAIEEVVADINRAAAMSSEEVSKLNEHLDNMRTELANQRQAILENAGSQVFREVEQRFSDAFQRLQAAYNTEQGKLDALRNADNISPEEDEKQRIASIQKYRDAQLKIYTEIINSLRSQRDIFYASGESLTDEEEARVLAITEALKKANNEYQKLVITKNADIADVENRNRAFQDIALKNSKKDLEDYVQILEANAVEAENSFLGLNGELERFNYYLNSGKFKDEKKLLVDAGMQAELDAFTKRLEIASARIEEFKEKQKLRTAGENAMSSVLDALTKETEEYSVNVWKAANGEGIMSEQTFSLQKRFAVLRGDVLAAGLSIKDFDNAVNKTISTANKNDALAFFEDLKDATRTLYRDTLTDAQRAQEEFAYSTERMKKMVQQAIQYLDKEAAAEMNGVLDKFIEYSEQKMAGQGKSLLSLIENDYKKSMNDMQEIAKDWVDQFVDTLAEGLATGEWEFSDFAENIIKQITRMMVQMSLLKALGLETGQSLATPFQAIMGLFAGGGSVASAGAASSAGSYFSDLGAPSASNFGSLTNFASGMTAIPRSSDRSGISEISIKNESGVPLAAKSADVDLDGRILNVVLEASQREGSFRRSLRSNLG